MPEKCKKCGTDLPLCCGFDYAHGQPPEERKAALKQWFADLVLTGGVQLRFDAPVYWSSALYVKLPLTKKGVDSFIDLTLTDDLGLYGSLMAIFEHTETVEDSNVQSQ